MFALVDLRIGERWDRYALAFTAADDELREAADDDGAWRALAAAIAHGRTIGALQREGEASPSAALVCRPAPAFADLWAER